MKNTININQTEGDMLKARTHYFAVIDQIIELEMAGLSASCERFALIAIASNISITS